MVRAAYVLCCWVSNAAAQTTTDSLVKVLEQLDEPKQRVELLQQLARQLKDTQPRQAITYAQQAYGLAQGDERVMARAQIAIGWSYYRLGEIDSAFLVSQAALKALEMQGDQDLQAEVLTNIAAIYNAQGQLERSLDYFQQSMQIYQAIGHDQGVGRCLNNIAFTNYKLQNYDTAQAYITRSIAHNSGKNTYYLAFAIRTKGDIHSAQNQTRRAIQNWEAALQLAAQEQLHNLQITCLNRLGKVYLQTKQYPRSLQFLRQATDLGERYRFRPELADSYLLLSQSYAAQNDHQRALDYHQRFFALHDSIFNEDNNKKINQLQARFENQQKEKQILLLQTEQAQAEAAYEKEAIRQRWVLLMVLLLFLTAGLVAALSIRSKNKIQKAYQALALANTKISAKNEEINQQKEEILQTLDVVNAQKLQIETQNQDITDSINYALRIQQNIMPALADLKQQLDCFVFFRPKDIVSGDFYWFTEKPNKKIVVVADCTGHGVSGAFLTIIANNILNHIIHDREIHEPERILNLMTPRLHQILSQKNNDHRITDGMDIAILTLTPEKIMYAGAMNPLYLVQNQQLQVLKPDKIPIGTREKGFAYQGQELLPQAGMMLYLFSDGYRDQFGGEKGRKLMSKNFKKLLQDISDLPTAQQQQVLSTHFVQWKGAYAQTDDVLVMGIRI